MPAPTILFIGRHTPLLQSIHKHIGGKFRLRQTEDCVLPSNPAEWRDLAMIIWQHDPGGAHVLPALRRIQSEAPQTPTLVFTAEFSGANARDFLKSGANDVFPLDSSDDTVLACMETYLPGFKLAPNRPVKKSTGRNKSLLLASAATSVMATLPVSAFDLPRQPESTPPQTERTGTYEPGIQLKFFGFFSINVMGKRVEFTKQARLLFAYLAYHHPRAFHRDHLARVFWPDKHENQPESARRSLNVELATVRKSLREQLGIDRDFIVFENNHYRLETGLDLNSDVFEFKCLTQQVMDHCHSSKPLNEGLFRSVMTAYHGEFLEDCPMESMNWVEVERQHLSAVFEQVAELYSAQLYDRGDFWKATAVCHEILARDPNIEVIHRRLMQCYAKLGMCNKVEAQYKLLCQILRSRFQSKPSVETSRLYETIHHENC